MSHIDDLSQIAGLSGLAASDQDEVVYRQRLFHQLDAASYGLADYISDPGFGGAAGDAATAWATSVRRSVQDVEQTLIDWLDAHDKARAVMREAAGHLPELEAIMAEAARLALSGKRDAIQQAIAMASGADAQAAQYIDDMNQALMGIALPRVGAGDRGGDTTEEGTVYRSPSGGGSSGGSGSGGSGGGLPDYEPPQPVPPWNPLGPPWGPPVPPPPVPPWPPWPQPWPPPPPPPPPPPVPPVPDPDVLKDWMAQHGMGLAAGAGLAGAAAVAAAVAYGSGGVASLAGLRGLSGVAPAGGVVTPGMGMAAPMGGAGGGQTGGKRKRRDYFAQHLDNPTDTPPDPGWGARAGSVADLPPVPDVEDEEW